MLCGCPDASRQQSVVQAKARARRSSIARAATSRTHAAKHSGDQARIWASASACPVEPPSARSLSRRSALCCCSQAARCSDLVAQPFQSTLRITQDCRRIRETIGSVVPSSPYVFKLIVFDMSPVPSSSSVQSLRWIRILTSPYLSCWGRRAPFSSVPARKHQRLVITPSTKHVHSAIAPTSQIAKILRR